MLPGWARCSDGGFDKELLDYDIPDQPLSHD